MNEATSNEDRFAEFKIAIARNQTPSAVHVPSGCLIHSMVDPGREAREIAENFAGESRKNTTLVGGGLGYLAEALLDTRSTQHSILVIEPDRILYQLARSQRGDSKYFNSPQIRVESALTASTVLKTLSNLTEETNLVISPYFLRLSEHDRNPLTDYARIVRAELASRVLYNPIIERHEIANRSKIATLPSVLSVRFPMRKSLIVCGAGPSLNPCFGAMQANRERTIIIAASGAVPALLTAGIDPDWVVALEAREAVLGDLMNLADGAKVIVFPTTHPANYDKLPQCRLFSGKSDDAGGLETWGGSSVIPALDFALRASTMPIFIVGTDLGWQNGVYAAGSKRSDEILETLGPLAGKFASMRAGLERILASEVQSTRVVYHVLENGNPLRGTIILSPTEMRKMLADKNLNESIHA